MSVSSSSKPRIAVLVHSLNEGGSQKRVISLANGFAARGHEVDLVAVSGAGTAGRLLAPAVRRTVLGKSAVPLPRSLAGVRALTSWLEREKPDVLMAGSAFSHALAALACAALRAPPLLVLRAASHPLRQLPWSRPYKRLRERFRRPVERWALRRADLVIAVSRESGSAISRMVGDRTTVVTVPNPTITAGFRAALGERVEHRWFDEAEAGGAAVILGVGRLAQSKDFETLVEAVAIANRSRPVKLLLLGEGKRRRSIEALVAKRGLADKVELMGHVDGTAAWLARADLLVSSSLWEGSPGAIIEALEAGVPVVATACPGGSVELLEGSSGGMLVPVRDPAAMAAAIVTMLARPRDRAALRRLAEPYQDDGRSEALYLAAMDAALARKTAAPG